MTYEPFAIVRRRGELLLAFADVLAARQDDASLLAYRERCDGRLLRHEWYGCTDSSMRSLSIQIIDQANAPSPYMAHCTSRPHIRYPFDGAHEVDFAARRAGDLSFCVGLLEYWLLDMNPVWQRFDLWQPARA